MEKSDQSALAGIRSLAFELVKNSSEKERKINIEDLGDYSTIQVTIRVIPDELRRTLERIDETSPIPIEL